MRKTKDFKNIEIEELKKVIQEKTGYLFHKNSLMTQAFVRSSYASEKGGEDNEILEFIGDQVLSYYVVKIIAEHFGGLNCDYEYKFRVRENNFTQFKQELVSNEFFAKIVDEWDITKYLIVGQSDYLNGVDAQVKVKSDLLEAVLGGIAVDSKWDGKVLQNVVNKILKIDEYITSAIKQDCSCTQFDIDDAVNRLKELAEHHGCSFPEYKYGTPEALGYDKDGNPIWCCTCSITNDKTGITRQVWSSSKKLSKKAAAYLVLCEHFECQNKYGINGKYSTWIYKNGKIMPEQFTPFLSTVL